MRYISTFRQQLPKDILLLTISELVRYINSNVPVVHTYTCHAIERILTVKTASNKENLILDQDLQNFVSSIIVNTLNILHPVTSENEYAIRLLMRVCMVMQEKIEPYLDMIITKLIILLNSISKNPSKPNFNHYLFETFGVLIRSLCFANKSLIE